MTQSTRPTISLCLIARNEAANLPDCLRPVAPLVDQIVVVDTGSTDKTREVAESFGAQIVDFPWCDDFAAARNAGVEVATGDWIFWLDADDRLDETNLHHLDELFGRLTKDKSAYIMDVRSSGPTSGEFGTIVNHPRLFLRSPTARWNGRVHEQILLSLEGEGYQILWSNVTIQHCGYEDEALMRRKTNRNLRLLRLDYAANPDDPVVLFNLGTTHLMLGDHGQALTYLLKAHTKVTRAGSWVRKLYAALVHCLLHLGRQTEALAMAMEGLANYPNDPELLLYAGEICIERGELGQAERLFSQLVYRSDREYLKMGIPEDSGQRNGRRSLGRVYTYQGRYDDAERVYQEMLAQYPDYSVGWTSLGYLYLQYRQYFKLDFVIRQVRKAPHGEAYALLLEIERMRAQGKFDDALASLDKLFELAPRMIAPRIIFAETLSNLNAPLEQILGAWRDVVQRDPSNFHARQMFEQYNLLASGQSTQSPYLFSTVMVTPSPQGLG